MSDTASASTSMMSDMFPLVQTSLLLNNYVLILVILTLICCSCFLFGMSLSLPMKADDSSCNIVYKEPEMFEQFEKNDEKMILTTNDSHFSAETIFLTSPNDENENPQHMMGGLCTRTFVDNKMIIDIAAHLYVLNGNVFGEHKEQQYKVYLRNDKTNQKVSLGTLKKENDGVYKLKLVLTTNVNSFAEYRELYIVFENDSTKYHIMLQGVFNDN